MAIVFPLAPSRKALSAERPGKLTGSHEREDRLRLENLLRVFRNVHSRENAAVVRHG